MAWANLGSKGQNVASGSGNVLTLSTLLSIETGQVAIVYIVADNSTSGDSQTSLITSLTDTSSNAYTKIAEFTNGQTAAAAGATVSLWRSTFGSGNGRPDITINFGANIAARGAGLWAFSKGAGNTISIAAIATKATDGAAPSTITISGLSSREYLWLHAVAHEGPNSDTITSSTNYSTVSGAYLANFFGTAGGSGTANMSGALEFRINTATGDIVRMPGTAADHAELFVALVEESATQAGTATLTFGAGASVLKGAGALAGSANQVFGAGASTLKGAINVAGSAALVFGSGASVMLATIQGAGTATMLFGAGASNLRGTAVLVGTAAEVFGAGASTLVGSGALVGSAALVFGSGASTLGGAKPILGAAALVFGSGASTLTGAAPLTGAATITFAPTGALTSASSEALVGTVAITFGAGASTLVGSLALSGIALETFGAGSSILTGSAALAATSALVFGAGASNLRGSAALAGTAAEAFGAGNSTLVGAGALAGTAALAFGGSASSAGEVQITGTAAMSFTVTATGTTSGTPIATEEDTTSRPRPDDGPYGDGKRRRTIYKPTGLHPRPRTVEDRIDISREIEREVSVEAQLAREFEADNAAFAISQQPIEALREEELNRELGVRLRAQAAKQQASIEQALMILMAIAL